MHLAEYDVRGRSAENVYFYFEKVSNERQKIVNTFLYMNKVYSTSNEDKILREFVRRLDNPMVQDSLIEAFYLLAWSRDMLENENVKEVLNNL